MKSLSLALLLASAALASRYCYTNDPGGSMRNLISSCVSGYSQPVPGNPGRSLDCIEANMSCGEPPACPPAPSCPGAPDTVYVCGDGGGSSSGLGPSALDSLSQYFIGGLYGGVILSIKAAFAAVAILFACFVFVSSYKNS